MADKSANPLVVLKSRLDERTSELKAALPANINPEKFKSAAIIAARGNPNLLTVDQNSLFFALLLAAQDGLLPDGREAVILPYKSKDKGMVAQYQPMVGGLLKRFRNSGEFKSIMAGVVREGEEFTHFVDEHGEHLKHVPGDGDGKIIKAYAVAKTKGGGIMIKVMGITDIERRRAVSKAKDGPMWSAFYDEAAMKTVLRNLSKRLPSSADIIELLERDDDPDAFKEKPQAFAGDAAAALDHFAGKDNPHPANDDPGPQDEGDPAYEDGEPGAEFAEEVKDNEVYSTAFQQGRKAKREGLQRRAVPGEYRTTDKTAEAKEWLSGWDSV